MNTFRKRSRKLGLLLAGIQLAVAAVATRGEILFTDGDFGLQTIGQAVGAPWAPVGAGNVVIAEAQSPFENIYPSNGKGAHYPASAGNPYIVRTFADKVVPATATGKLYFNVDFRNNTADPGDYSIVITHSASGAARSVACYVTGDALYADSAAGKEQVATLETEKWYNLQLTLDLDLKTYEGVLASQTDRTVIPSRSFVGAAQMINCVYSDGGTSFVAGTAPDHDLDNWALSDTPLASLAGGAYVLSTAPKGAAVSNKAAIIVQLTDLGTQVAPSSIQLSLNGSNVVPVIAKPAGSDITTVTYTPTSDLRPGTYNVRISFGDNSTPQVVKASEYSFTVPGPSVTLTAPTGEGNKPGTPITIDITDLNTQLAPASIRLFVNDQSVTPIITKPAGSTVSTLTYAPAEGFASGSSNTVRLVFTDNSNPPIESTRTFSFQVVDPLVAASSINIDFKGIRNVPGPDIQGPTYSGVGAAGGGVVFNGLVADSRVEGGTDDDLLTVSGVNLLDSLGDSTTIGFTISPMGGDVGGGPTTDPKSMAALFSDYIFNNSAGNTAGESPFTISGLGDVPFVDLYFYRTSGGITIPGFAATPIIAHGIYTPGNTIFFSHVPVTNGEVSGTFGSGTAVVVGMSIVKPTPRPFVKSATPQGAGVRPQSSVVVELQDYVTQVASSSIQLLLNGTKVTPVVNKPAGTTVTTVSYAPAGGFAQGASFTAQIIFGDSSSPSVLQTNDFSFSILSEASAALTVNIDINGARNVPGPRGPGPTYVGVGPGGGGSTWNGIIADSRLEDGTDEDNLTVGGENLLDSLGGATTIGFSIATVGGDDGGAPPGTDPASQASLLGDYLFVGSAGQVTGSADFTISGLGAAPFVDLYFVFGANGTFTIPGASSSAFPGSGIFTAGNTRFFRKAPVVNGTITGTLGTGQGNTATLLYGLTVQKPLPQPFLISFIPATGSGTKLRTNEIGIMKAELQDYISKVVPGSIEFSLNGQAVTPQIATDASKGLTTITYDSYGKLSLDQVNAIRIVFADDASPSVKQTNDFSFYVVSEEAIGRIVNLDFNGVRNVPGPDVPGPTYSGVGPAGGGIVFNGISADSRIDGGTDNDNLTVGAQNLLNSFGVATTVGFTVGPMGGDVGGAPTEDAQAAAALLSDYIFNNSAGNTAGLSPFTISGLGSAATADLYFLKGPGTITIAGSTATPYGGSGIYTPGNTVFFAGVPVVGGKIEGTFGTGVTVIYGMTVAWSGASTSVGPISIARQGTSAILSWNGAGVLQAASQVTGGWDDVQGATSPHSVSLPAGDGDRFYRLRR